MKFWNGMKLAIKHVVEETEKDIIIIVEKNNK